LPRAPRSFTVSRLSRVSIDHGKGREVGKILTVYAPLWLNRHHPPQKSNQIVGSIDDQTNLAQVCLEQLLGTLLSMETKTIVIRTLTRAPLSFDHREIAL